MNKVKVGNFLRELRLSKKSENGKSWTQSDLTKKLDDENEIEISEKAVSDWELESCQ